MTAATPKRTYTSPFYQQRAIKRQAASLMRKIKDVEYRIRWLENKHERLVAERNKALRMLED